MTAGDLRFRILSPDHQVVHNVLHSELQDRGSAVGFIWLRQLLDLVAICRHYDEGVDWCGVRNRFARHGLERILVARLYMANRLLDLPMPAGIRPTLAARLHYQRCLSQLRWRWPMADGSGHKLVGSYKAVDTAIAEIISAVDLETTHLLIFALHGMGPNNSQVHFVPKILDRMHAGERRNTQEGSLNVQPQRSLVRLLRERLPAQVQHHIASLVSQPMRDWVGQSRWNRW